MTEIKWKPHSSNNCFEKRSNQASANDVLGGDLGKRANSVKNYQKSEKKWKTDLEYIKKHNKMLFSMAKRLGLLRKPKTIKNIHYKASKKHS